MSKKLITLIIAFTISITCFAQQGINYKAVLKDTNGNVLAGTFMNVQFTIHETTATGTIAYQENHNNYTTDANGLVILNIGTGSPNVGVFNDIDWSADKHFLQTTISYGDNAISFDATEFMAVPYAKYAETAGNLNWTRTGSNIENNNPGVVNVMSTTGNPFRVTSTSTDNFIGFYNSEGYQGYTGIYTDDNDMDFGTGVGNSTGKVHLTTLASPKLTVIPSGFVGVDTQNPTQRLEVNGKIKVGNDAEDSTEGTIRYNSSSNDFEGYNGSQWNSFTQSRSAIPSGAIPITGYANNVLDTSAPIDVTVISAVTGSTLFTGQVPSNKYLLVTTLNIEPATVHSTSSTRTYFLRLQNGATPGNFIDFKGRYSNGELVRETSALAPLLIGRPGNFITAKSFDIGSLTNIGITNFYIKGFLVDNLDY